MYVQVRCYRKTGKFLELTQDCESEKLTMYAMSEMRRMHVRWTIFLEFRCRLFFMRCNVLVTQCTTSLPVGNILRMNRSANAVLRRIYTAISGALSNRTRMRKSSRRDTEVLVFLSLEGVS